MILYGAFSILGIALFWLLKEYVFGEDLGNIFVRCVGYFLMIYGLISGGKKNIGIFHFTTARIKEAVSI